MRPLVAATLVALCVSCSGSSGSSADDSGIRGRVLAGPQCPVEVAGSPCPDQPVAADIEVTDSAGHVVRTERSDDDGGFEIDLDPGRYSVEAKAATSGPFPVGQPVQVAVRAHEFTHITLHMDTGIR